MRGQIILAGIPGLLMLGAGAIDVSATFDFRRRAVATEAVVVAHIARTARHQRGHVIGTMYTPVVEYANLDGRRVRFTAEAASDWQIPAIGSRVTVRYDPNHPDDTRLDGFRSNWFWPLVWLVFGSTFTGLSAALFCAQRSSGGKSSRSPPL